MEIQDSCCDNEANHLDDENEDVICASCGEHTCPVVCIECGDVVFESSCCG